MAHRMQPRVQRGFKRLGVIFGVLAGLLTFVVGWMIAGESSSTYYAFSEKNEKLNSLKVRSGTCGPYVIIKIPEANRLGLFDDLIPKQANPPESPPVGPLQICVTTSDGQKHRYTYTDVSHEQALQLTSDKIEAEYEATVSAAAETFRWRILAAAVGAIAAGFIIYGVFAAMGWALAGFAKEA